MKREKDWTIGIRADGNSEIGMGHLMRCLSIAAALREEKVKVLFFTSTLESAAVILERGFLCHVTGVPYNQKERELPVIDGMLRETKVKLLLVDSYQVTENYMAALDMICPVFYLDDTGERGLPASGFINYNIYGDSLPYRELLGEETELLLGSKYAPVRAEFSKTPYQVRDKVHTVLVTMGGSDSLNISGVLCEKLLQNLPGDIRVVAICGRFNPHLETLENMAKNSAVETGREMGGKPRLEILVDVKDMWTKLAQADICISAAGSTMYELATMGVPTICCYYVENQRQIAEGFANKTEMINAGDFSADGSRVLDRILAEVEVLIKDSDKRKSLSASMRTVTDGKGAFYLAQSLKEYMEKRK